MAIKIKELTGRYKLGMKGCKGGKNYEIKKMESRTNITRREKEKQEKHYYGTGKYGKGEVGQFRKRS